MSVGGSGGETFGATAIVDEHRVDEHRVDEHWRRAPAEPLRPYVAWYTGYRQRGVPPAVHRGLPSPFLTLILTLDEPLTMAAHADPRQPPGEFGTLLGGLHSSPALIVHEGAQSGIQVALRPLGARTLLGLPAGELAAIDVPADAVLGRVQEARARILAADGWAERFAILDEVLLAAVACAAPGVALRAAPEVGWAWRRLLRSGGVIVVHGAAAGGRAGDPAAHDAEVAAVREAARLIAENELLTPALVPLGDGLLAAVRD